MPKINRIRIANVPYSGRHIVDQTIKCYEGENVLLNLANGGGKSVLTQMIMQPIVPNVKIHKRKVESYLTSKEPTFVMIEWLLDNTNQPTYLLTGIVMNKAITEENNYRVRYFTFINEYKSSNPYDIKNIEFITKENEITKYKSYEYCLKTLREKEGNQSKIEVFTIDEQKRYNQILEENGIFKDEWKILAKINEKEGGIDDLFEKCEKSDDVINQWILKTISEKLENVEELREMFLNLMIDVMNHEKEIKQKEELENFKEEANLYIKELTELLQSMDKEEKIKKDLEEIYLKLNMCINKQSEKGKILKGEIEEKDKELEVIEYEKISEEYYKVETELEYIKEKEEKTNNKMINLDKEYSELKNRLRTLEASKIYEEYKEAKAEKEAAFIAKENLENKMNKDEIKNIEYSLKKEYEKEICDIGEKIGKLKEKLEQTIKEQQNIEEKREENTKRNVEIQKKIAIIKSNIEEFEKEEKEILQKLNINLGRNILKELDKKEIEKVKNNYINIEQQQKISIKENEERIQNNNIQLENNDIEIKQIDEKIEKFTNNIKEKEIEIDEYKNQTQKLEKIIESYAIDNQRLFDKETNLIEIERQKEFIRKRKNENTEKLNKNSEILYSLKNGGIHVDLEIGKILAKNKIEYETGEEYLKEQAYEYQQKLLQKNPMLPYSYIILNKKDYEKIEELAINETINRLTPILLYEEIEKDFEPKNKIIQIGDKVKLQCLYNVNAFDEKLKKEFEINLEQEIEELEENIKNDETKLVNIENDIKFIKQYKYTTNSEQNLKQELNELKEEKDNIKLKKDQIREENKKIVQEQTNIKDEINELEKVISENTKNKEMFDEYLIKDEQYINNYTNKNKLEKILQETDTIENELKEKNEKNSNEIDILNKETEANKNIQENYIQKNDKIGKIEDAQKIDKTLQELEQMYQEINSNILRSEKEIQEKIDKAMLKMAAKEKELNKRYQELKEEYEKTTYVEEEEDTTREKIEILEKERKNTDEENKKIGIEKAKLETKLENSKNKMKELGKDSPIQTYLIKKNYEERKEKIKEQISTIKNNLNILENEIEKLKEKKNFVLAIIEEPEYKIVDITDFDYNNIPIKELKKELKQREKESEERKRNVDNLYRGIENRNSNKEQTIQKFLKNMNPHQNEDKFVNYYFTYEKVINCSENLDKMLQLLQTTIANIENDKNNIKHHAYIQGKNIYLEMKQISDNSDIKMPGKLRKTPLLEIQLPKELDQYAEERIENYIEECITTLRQECSGQENIRQIVEKRIKDWLSDRQLLNIVINSETIGVRLYKIDISEKNSGLKTWEEVIVDNSGGEKLISCLILVLALMQYTRNKVLLKYGEEEKSETSKFLVIDNPFGKMSSTHLLDGLMLILKRFNVQAICLSDISQSSITNQFKVIYQLSLKTGKYTDKIYLTTDNIIKSPELIDNYLLEQAYIKVDSQLKMW